MPVSSSGRPFFPTCTRCRGRRQQAPALRRAFPALSPLRSSPHSPRHSAAREPRRDRPLHRPHRGTPAPPVPCGSSELRRPAPRPEGAGGCRSVAGAPQRREPLGGGGRAVRGRAALPAPGGRVLLFLPTRRRWARAWSWRESIKSLRETRPPCCQRRGERLRCGAAARQRHHDQPELPVGLRQRQR